MFAQKQRGAPLQRVVLSRRFLHSTPWLQLQRGAVGAAGVVEGWSVTRRRGSGPTLCDCRQSFTMACLVFRNGQSR